MKTQYYLVLLFSLYSFGCASWGYQGGASYVLVETKDIYLNVEEKKIYTIRNVRNKVSISFYDNAKVLFEEIYVDSTKLKLPYQIPDNIILFSKQKNMRIEVRIDDKWYYEFNLVPSYWEKMEKQYAQMRNFK
jgi:hypothetical protein